MKKTRKKFQKKKELAPEIIPKEEEKTETKEEEGILFTEYQVDISKEKGRKKGPLDKLKRLSFW